jgi:hypothetical protein
MRGGARIGAGRKKGSKDKPKESTAFSLKAREFAEFYRGMLDRARKGVKPTAAEKEKMTTLSAELAGRLEEQQGGQEAALEDILPLDLMLRYMRDPREDKEFRVRLATAAAPYCHPRKGEGAGKKDEKQDRAAKAGAGRFAASAPPQLKVVGK